jgi:hypothetical protein
MVSGNADYEAVPDCSPPRKQGLALSRPCSRVGLRFFKTFRDCYLRSLQAAWLRIRCWPEKLGAHYTKTISGPPQKRTIAASWPGSRDDAWICPQNLKLDFNGQHSALCPAPAARRTAKQGVFAIEGRPILQQASGKSLAREEFCARKRGPNFCCKNSRVLRRCFLANACISGD